MEGNGTFKVLVTDVTLGDGINGWEVARRVRQKEPLLPAVYVTGSNAEEWASHGVPSSILIPKPFVRAQLLAALSNLLNIGAAAQT